VIETLVVGAGVTGLACARELAARGREVLVVERAARAGGVVGTIERDGWRFESGPNTIPATAATFRRLVGELGLAGRLIVSSPAAKRRYLFHRGRLRALPAGPGGLLATPLLSPAAKLHAASEPLRRFAPPAGDEPTLEAFLAERFGRAVARTLGGAFVRGVYGAEVEELGAASAFPRLWKLAVEHGGVLRGLKAGARSRVAEPLPGPVTGRGDLVSFPGGLVELVDALAAALGPRLVLACGARALERAGDAWRVELERGEPIVARSVVLTIPAPATVELLSPLAASAGVDLAPLARLAHADLGVIHLGLVDADLPQGFGFLVPPDEAGPRALGVLFPSRIFAGRAPAGGSTVTAIVRASELGGADDAGALELAHADLRRAVGERAAGRVAVGHVTRWRGVIPRYGVGHRERMQRLAGEVERSWPGLVLAGAYRDGVSVEDCLARGLAVGRECAERGDLRERRP